jgi:hypothetical protein
MTRFLANIVGLLALLIWLLPAIVVALHMGWWIATGGVLLAHLTTAGASFIFASGMWLLVMWVPLACVANYVEEL